MALQPAPKERVRVDGRELTLTNLDKVIYPETGTTKADVLAYYAAVANVLIPAAANRPATRKRWVHGVGTAEEPGQVFFQKNLDDSTPGWVPRAAIEHKDHTNFYPLVNDSATLTWLGQIAALEIHVPQWRVDSHGNALPPDRMVLDLDPGEGAGLAECVQVANLARAILKDVGLDAVPVTSGSKGIHLYAGLDGTQSSEQISAFAHELARALEADHPGLVVSDMKKSLRTGKVLVDWSQNSGAKTTIVPYSLRGRPLPTVAAPRTWRELASPALQQLDYKAVMRRVKDGKDPFAAVSAAGGPIYGKPDGGTDDLRLISYRSKRDPGGTPEPFTGSGSSGETFVIHEHNASRLHYDLRLEHEGVLVSWALPKGVPVTGAKNHLAVQTEDHPLDYGKFEGTIPKGQYGAGTMKIWDSGVYECHKWINGREVIATLTGTEGGGLEGTKKFALIHTGQSGGQDPQAQWLIHLMDGGAGAHSRTHSPSGSAASTAAFSEEVTPMLATAGTAADLHGSDWQFELKWDGIRALIVADDRTVRILSRTGKDMSPGYPELTDRACWPAQGFTADGEIVAVGRSGRPDFGLLQRRMNLSKPADVEKARASVPVRLMLFDLLSDGGEDLRRLPLKQRQDRLQGFYRPSACPVDLSQVLDGPVEHILESAQELGLEGVMAKRLDSRYVSGQRTRLWIKLKFKRTQEVVIGGWRPGKGERQSTVGSLLLGIPDGNELRYVGRVGSGFSTRELKELRQTMDGLARKTSPFRDVPDIDAADANWVTPGLVGEVTFGDWTNSGRLRHPVWRGWRLDKKPEQVVPEGGGNVP